MPPPKKNTDTNNNNAKFMIKAKLGFKRNILNEIPS